MTPTTAQVLAGIKATTSTDAAQALHRALRKAGLR